MLTHPQLTLDRDAQADSRTRRTFIVNGIAGEERTLKVNDPDLGTLHTALMERVFFHKVNGVYEPVQEPQEVVVFDRLRAFKRSVCRYVGRATAVSPESFAQMYTGRKRTIYEQAVEQYTTYGVRRSDAYSDSFVKCEKVPHDKAPRCIQPRRPVYNVGVGRHLKPIEHRIYKAIQRSFGSITPVVVKGFNAVQTAGIIAQKFNTFERTVALGLDASRFDQHVSQQMLRWEHSVYNSIFRSKELARLLKWQIDNVGFGRCDDGTLKYRVKGRRFSGDMNTALGNCLIMCAMIHAYAAERGVNIELANNGDDCVVMMEAGDLDTFTRGLDEWFDDMGFVMTSEVPVYNLHQIEFCQTRPVIGHAGLIMCRNLEKAREKDSMCTLDISGKNARAKWMGAVGECGLALSSGVPVMQEMYKAYVRYGKPSKIANSVGWECGMTMMAKGLHARERPVTDEARFAFYIAHGTTPDEQVALEEYYSNWQMEETVNWDVDLDDVYPAPY